MLFAVKRTPGPAIAVLVCFVVASVSAHFVLGTDVPDQSSISTFRDTAIGILGLLILDGTGHLLLTDIFGRPYRRSFRAFARYFEGQSAIAIGTAGFLAAGEELFFRGVLLTMVLRTMDPVAPIGAIALAAVVFGAFHLTPSSLPSVFVLWAVWEGLLLGGLYVITGSLLVAALSHALHDIVGFYVLRRWRRHDALRSDADVRT